jgi:glucosamine-phosphate N-acetyltransferase
MFSPDLLVGLETPKNERFSDYSIRPLQKSDFEEQYECLKQLTQIGEPTQEMFDERFDWMTESGCYYVIMVVEKSTGKAIATGTLIVEKKFIHECCIRGRVEDVVVHDSQRKRGLGKLIVASLTELSKNVGCYKTTLECSSDNRPFYEKMGYEAMEFEKYMVKRF